MKKLVFFFCLIFSFTSFLHADDFSNDKCFIRGFLYADILDPKVPDHYLEVKPNLWIDQRTKATFSPDGKIGLIGFAVDVRNSKKSLETIVDNLANTLSKSEKKFHDEEDFLCGRYVIFYQCPTTMKVLADATTMRKVFYSDRANIIAGHAKLVAHQLQSENLESICLTQPEARIPFIGNKTPYQGVFILTPNHSLEVGTGNLSRIFPRTPYSPLSESKAIELYCKYGKEALKGAEAQQEKTLLFSLTSGLDSRTTLSFANILQNPYKVFSFQSSIRGNARDREEAKKICLANNISLLTANSDPHEIPDMVKDALESNCYIKYTYINYFLCDSILNKLGEENYLLINSNILEVGKGWSFFSKYKEGVNDFPRNTKYARGFGLNRDKLKGYDPLQFYFLEQQFGAILANHFFCYDLSCDIFNCFNSRAILNVILRSTNSKNNLIWGRIQKYLIENAWYYAN